MQCEIWASTRHVPHQGGRDVLCLRHVFGQLKCVPSCSLPCRLLMYFKVRIRSSLYSMRPFPSLVQWEQPQVPNLAPAGLLGAFRVSFGLGASLVKASRRSTPSSPSARGLIRGGSSSHQTRKRWAKIGATYNSALQFVG